MSSEEPIVVLPLLAQEPWLVDWSPWAGMINHDLSSTQNARTAPEVEMRQAMAQQSLWAYSDAIDATLMAFAHKAFESTQGAHIRQEYWQKVFNLGVAAILGIALGAALYATGY
jgi:hypothetical protein